MPPLRCSVAAVACLRNPSGECPPGFRRAARDHDLRSVGTGTPAIFSFKEPRLVRVQKYAVFQSSPPNATLAVLPKPWTMRPSFLPVGSRIYRPPAPPQKTLPAESTFMPSG